MSFLKDKFKLKPQSLPEPSREIPDRIQGKIFHVNKKGFFFIEADEIPKERIYGHWKSLNHNTKRHADLKNGDIVEFTPKKYSEEKGWVALRIMVIE